MLILIDKKIPAEAKKSLAKYGEILEIETSGITYEAISGHPDIFFFNSGFHLITAPNLPQMYIDVLSSKGIIPVKGITPLSKAYPDTARYNAAISESYFIHNTGITDRAILEDISGRQILNVRQGYCRCSLLPLRGDSFITSDGGIYKRLKKENLNSVFIEAKEVVLPGFPHGFLGGALGVSGDNVFVIGSLKYLSEGNKLRGFLDKLGYKIIELYDGPLFDGGSVMGIMNDELLPKPGKG